MPAEFFTILETLINRKIRSEWTAGIVENIRQIN